MKVKANYASKVAVLFLGLSSHGLQAGGVNWGSSLGDVFTDSLGVPLTDSWAFHLGFFEAGFSPTAENTEDWSSQWTTLDISQYEPAISSFGGIWPNDGISTGQIGYIWGLNRSLESNQWILVRADDWIIPVDSPILPNVDWFTLDITEVVVGSFATASLTTAVTEGAPAFLSAEQWLALQFNDAQLLDDSISGLDADPDQDGQTNLEEFAFGNDPQQADVVCIEAEVEGGFFRFTSPRVRNAEVAYFGQVSSNLIDWSEETSAVVLESELSEFLTFRDLTPVAEGPRFGSVRVELLTE